MATLSFSPANPRETEILRIVWREFPHVSAERLISGIGLDPLYRAIAELNGKTGPAPPPATISEHALRGDDELCCEVMNTFCAMLGTAAGNLAVTLGARGGIHIGGGIVPKLGEFFDRSPFRQRFEFHGRFSDYLKAIPTKVILAEYPALTGLHCIAGLHGKRHAGKRNRAFERRPETAAGDLAVAV